MRYCIFFLLNLFLWTSCEQKTRSEPSVPVIQAEDWDLSLKGFGIPDTNLENLKGKVIFLNFWGSWCPPCREEMPSIQALYNQYGKEVEFVLIPMNESSSSHQNYLKENGYKLPVYEAKSLISNTFKPKVFPTTFIINRSGDIIYSLSGARDWNQKEIHDLLDKSLKN